VLGDGPLLAVEQAVVLSEDPTWCAPGRTGTSRSTRPAQLPRQLAAAGDGRGRPVRGGSDRLKDAMVVGGDEATIAARVQAHLDAGADHVCLQVLGDDAFSVPGDDWVRLAPAMADLRAARL
jgi:hypothetical protein